MTSNEAWLKFGLPAELKHRNEIQRLLGLEIEFERQGEGGEEMLRTLCLQLFSLGYPEDALLIWEAKQSSFDAGCGLDVQLLCGAGLTATKDYLSRASAPEASAVLKYLAVCEKAGDFDEWTPQATLDTWRSYYGF
ncbi:hypothetical protein WJU23_17310 [Prosthecobacter sp. SYSU 5D2]|uniref:hypothetical protein n=1 Tax=Prosthecobacter sp. SYSU 5D2 TaxID=3134134 RepID=UPI0031FF4215